MTTQAESTKTPYRQIRASYTDSTITVYQAYNKKIASAAVEHQKLDASPLFRSRMTWIKPSWAWMMYRAGYSYKDSNQSNILAIKMSHEGFLQMLRSAELTTHAPNAERPEKTDKPKVRTTKVKVQWDPERSAKMERLDYRSIQIGIAADMVPQWINEWIVEIEDVTEMARNLKAAIDENPNVDEEDLKKRGLVPEEKEFLVPQDIYDMLRMDVSKD